MSPFLRRTLLRSLSVSLAGMLVSSLASATDLTTQKLFGHWTPDAGTAHLGSTWQSTAVSSKWAIVGAPEAKTNGIDQNGGVQVFNAVTGAWVRSILPPTTDVNAKGFGTAIALAGDLAVIGTPEVTGFGKAYLYNVSTGARLRTFDPGGFIGDAAGSSVATNGDVVAVGAPNTFVGVNANQGLVKIFNLATGALLATLSDSAGASGDHFGSAVVIEGSQLVVSAPDGNSSHGVIYFYDLKNLSATPSTYTSSFVTRAGRALALHQGRLAIGAAGSALLYDIPTGNFTSLPPSVAETTYGSSVAIDGSIVAVGAPGFTSGSTAGAGAIEVFDVHSATVVGVLSQPSALPLASQYGSSVALSGGLLLATSPIEQANHDGAAYLIRTITRPAPFHAVAAKGDSAPGGTEINYGALNDPVINDNSIPVFTSALSGTGSNSGHDVGLFDYLPATGASTLVLKTRNTLFTGVSSGSFGPPNANCADWIINVCTRVTPSLTSANNQMVLCKSPAGFYQFGIFAEDSIPALDLGHGAPAPTSFQDLAVSNHNGVAAGRIIAVACNLRLGTAGVTASTDSAIVVSGDVIGQEGAREGQGDPSGISGVFLGQIPPRVAMFNNRYAYAAALTSTGTAVTPATNAALYRRKVGVVEELIARKGVTPVGGGVTYSSFIGESLDDADNLVFRATLSGTGISTTNNEGIWRRPYSGATVNGLVKGQILADLPGVRIGGIINFWAVPAGTSAGQVLALIKLTGTGVTAANDQALVAVDTIGGVHVLIREGDPAPGCPGARIGVLSRVTCQGKTGAYALLATLSGADAGSELALYTGSILRFSVPTARPFLRLRKGQLFDNQPSKILSMSFLSDATASGAGGTGHGRCISTATTPNSNFALTITFANGVQQTVTTGVE